VANDLKIAIGIPSPGMWYADFAMNLIALMNYSLERELIKNRKTDLRVIHNRGSILPKQRLEIVKNAQEAGADYLLWLDCDHTFPANLLEQLLSHKKDVCAINCVTKSIPANPTARQKSETILGGAPVYSYPNAKLERVWRVGTGVMLVDMNVFEKTGANIFHMQYREDTKSYQGEDWTMCEAIEREGFEIWVDHELSVQVGHIGMLNYRHDLVPETAQYY
jgi:hypothetical protein